MGIQLDWQIDAEQEQVRQAGEDPNSARRRRRARLRVLLLMLLVITLFGAAAAGIVLRLRLVDEQIEKALRDTAEAEVAALRIGDAGAFLSIQRSATDDWLSSQQAAFDLYQNLKVNQNTRLTGRIIDAEVDGARGRAQIEEIIDGVPYVRVWFYWRYDDGWRHVPPDYTFWGALAAERLPGVTVRYRSVDVALARDVAAKLANWRQTGCAALGCGELPAMTVDILPDEALALDWSAGDPWMLQFPSPYTDRARLDMPFDLNLQLQVATLLAERMVAEVSGNMQPAYPADAYYLRSAVGSWLVGKFVQIDTNSFLVSSLAQNYGESSVGVLLEALQPQSGADILAAVTGVPALEQANLDWRDFLTWRLVLENDLITRQDETSFLGLYDTRDEVVRQAAYQRYAAGPASEQRVVLSALPETDPDGSAVLRAVVQVDSGEAAWEEVVRFRLVEGQWRRAN